MLEIAIDRTALKAFCQQHEVRGLNRPEFDQSES
jgi:hypothetical protein